MHALPDEQVERNSSTGFIFAKNIFQIGYTTDAFGYGANDFVMNLRFHWLQTAGTGLFVVYNDTEGLNGIGPADRYSELGTDQQIPTRLRCTHYFSETPTYQ
jgi:hypothetical protein